MTVVALGDDCNRVLGFHRKSVKPAIEVFDRKNKIWVNSTSFGFGIDLRVPGAKKRYTLLRNEM